MTTTPDPTNGSLGASRIAIAPVRFTNATLDNLTNREREVLELITNGYSNAEVGRLLFISINSIKTYVRSIYRKIGAETRAHAVVWGVRHGLLADYEPSSGAPADGEGALPLEQPRPEPGGLPPPLRN